MTTHQCRVNLAEAELQPGILQSAVEGNAFVGVGHIVPVVFGLNGHQGTDGVVRRLHEIGGL